MIEKTYYNLLFASIISFLGFLFLFVVLGRRNIACLSGPGCFKCLFATQTEKSYINLLVSGQNQKKRTRDPQVLQVLLHRRLQGRRLQVRCHWHLIHDFRRTHQLPLKRRVRSIIMIRTIVSVRRGRLRFSIARTLLESLGVRLVVVALEVIVRFLDIHRKIGYKQSLRALALTKI